MRKNHGSGGGEEREREREKDDFKKNYKIFVQSRLY